MSTTLSFRVGIGHDTHRLVPGGPLRLGGVDIPHDKQLFGHSDADVLLHAVIDALLGASGLGDIGEIFPDTDPSHRGRSSAEMLGHVVERVRDAGWQIVNVDCIVFAERPKLTCWKPALASSIARGLGVDPQAIGIKAKTGEQIGSVGTEMAIMAQCVVLLAGETTDGASSAPSTPPGKTSQPAASARDA
jgi:2-C-methyl-D-erythritol 2,4-cyclodiphosphate synthase